MSTDAEPTTVRIVRGVATGLSFVYATLLLLFFVIGVPLIFVIADERPKGDEILQVVGVVLPLIAAFVAIVLAWIRETLGGAACVSASIWLMVALAITLNENQLAASTIVGIPLLVCGLMYLLLGVVEKRTGSRT